jgi:hypothetical protein
VLIWYFSQAIGGILTGMATDFNSRLLLVVMALAVWPCVGIQQSAHARSAHKVRQAYPEQCWKVTEPANRLDHCINEARNW